MWNYTKTVKEHFLNPKNVGVIKNADGIGEVGSLACGDALKLTFKISKNGTIDDAKFQTFGCASAIASSSALTEMIKGKTIEEAEKITNKNIADFLGGLPKEKIHCSVMGKDALTKAIAYYKKDFEKSKKDEILCECFEITNSQIKKEVTKNKLNSIEEVTSHTKAGGGCENCHNKIQEIIDTNNKTITKYKIDTTNKTKKLTNLQKIKIIESAFEKDIKPALKQDGGDIELIDVDANKVTIKLHGACASCGKSQITLKHYVETSLRKLISQDINVEEV